MVNIHGHTIEESVLGEGVIIDIGCRDFKFAKHFEGKKVFCIDPDSDVIKPADVNVEFLNLAIAENNGAVIYYRNGESTRLGDSCPSHAHLHFPCKTITMDELYKITGENVDLLKLDCEGAEYIILGDGFKPIPKQITVEFHHHTVPETHDNNIDKVMKNLLEHYDLAYQHESGMDNLFIRKNKN